ncbi:MAG: hypothetical protein HIU89_01560 [Proteobacteria bacterium]|nr:hypothetical protein [Pseudomonadota bacterium]
MNRTLRLREKLIGYPLSPFTTGKRHHTRGSGEATLDTPSGLPPFQVQLCCV